MLEEILLFFADYEGQPFADIPAEHKAALLDLKHKGLGILAFPRARLTFTPEGNMLLAEARRKQADEQHQQNQQAQQRILDAQKARKDARHNFWKKCGYAIAAAIVAPLLAFLGNKILDALILVQPKVVEIFEQLFHIIPSSP